MLFFFQENTNSLESFDEDVSDDDYLVIFFISVKYI